MLRLVVLACVCIGCKGDKDKPAPTPSPSPAPTPVPAADPCAKARPEGPLAWITDDYPAAVACAKKQDLPLVIDLWAPWCHTCLSMQATVFVDPSFAADAKRFVFASLDTDRESNAPALTKLAISAWPTFYVLGPDETVLSRFVGGASLAQFHEFLDAGDRARKGGIAAGDAHLLGAERALAVKDLAAAESELAAALKVGPVAWLRRPEVLGQLIMTKQKRSDWAGCLDIAAQYMDETGNAAVASDFLVSAMTCAHEREKDDAAKVKALRERAVARWRALLADASAPLSVDDRSDAMASLRETLDTLGKPDEAKKVAEQQLALLDAAAAKATSPLAAMTYNWHRADVYVYLKRPLDIVPALEKSAKDLPDEYDPPARLGWVYWKAGKLPEAAEWTDKALKLAYGPRKARVLAQRAEIAKAAGDAATERSNREQVVKLMESLPESQKSLEALVKAKQALAAMDAGSGSATGSGSGSAGMPK